MVKDSRWNFGAPTQIPSRKDRNINMFWMSNQLLRCNQPLQQGSLLMRSLPLPLSLSLAPSLPPSLPSSAGPLICMSTQRVTIHLRLCI